MMGATIAGATFATSANSHDRCGVRLLTGLLNAEFKASHCRFSCKTSTSIHVRRGCRASFSCRLPNAEEQGVPFTCGSLNVDKVCECASTGCATHATPPIALAMQSYVNLSVASLLSHHLRSSSSSSTAPVTAIHTHARLAPLDYLGPPDAPATVAISEEHDCRLLIGNHIHEVLNAVIIALALGLRLARTTSTYTCKGLFESTGLFEALPLVPSSALSAELSPEQHRSAVPANTRRSIPLCPATACDFEADLRKGTFRLSGPSNATYHAGPRLGDLNAAGRFQVAARPKLHTAIQYSRDVTTLLSLNSPLDSSHLRLPSRIRLTCPFRIRLACAHRRKRRPC